MKVLVTGVAGFIGMHVVEKLLERGDTVYGIDNINDYYSTELKRDRLSRLLVYPSFKFEKMDISDRSSIENLFNTEKFDGVIHLAAQAGVRYSIENPHAYINSNVVGFINILEACRRSNVGHLAYASSSSVYGGNTKVPFSEDDSVNHPVSIYAATKKSNELMAHSYSHLFGIPTTGLRFFTVYGPWGRPDMALFLFTEAMLKGEPIKIFNMGKMKRDFTYVDDVVAGVIASFDNPPIPSSTFNHTNPAPSLSSAPYRIINIGNQRPVELMAFVHSIEDALGIQANKIFLPLQDGDVVDTFADTSKLAAITGAEPNTDIKYGVSKFIQWYKTYYNYN